MKALYYYNMPVGRIGIAQDETGITHIFTKEQPEFSDYEQVEAPFIKMAKNQLEEYFSGTRKAFDVPLNPAGTPFQKKVWQALLEIPYGETRSYGQIAAAAGNKNASRAVGGANNKNPIMIVIPCHRVIGADGKLVGYGGGIDMKIVLLKLEGYLK